MNVSRILAVLSLCVLALSAGAEGENQDYQSLNPPQTPTTPGNKVEVVEFFSYGCPHCYAMQPLISKWAAQLPQNVAFVRVPVSFGRREWGQLSRAFYALQATGDLARVDEKVFDAIHKDRRPIFDEESLVAWAVEQGVDAGKFRAAFESPAVSSKALRAEELSRDYKVSGVPTVVVDGKYVVLGKTHEDQLKIAQQLVDKATAERSGKK